MKAGVSTACLFPQSMEQALHLLGRQGIRLCECFFNTPRELKPEAVTRLKAAAGSYGMEIGSVHGFHSEMETFFFFTDYPGRLEDGLEQYRRYYEAAARLGAKYLIFHGDFAMNRSFSEEKAFDNIRCLWEEGRRFGVELLHENVARCKGGRPDYLARLHRGEAVLTAAEAAAYRSGKVGQTNKVFNLTINTKSLSKEELDMIVSYVNGKLGDEL